MKLPVKLQELLQENEQTIATISTLIGQGSAMVDCSGVEAIVPEHLTLLLSGIPADWDFVELAQVLDQETLTESFAHQLTQEIDRRLGRETKPVQQPSIVAPSSPDSRPTLDVFNLRQEVISDYRRYIESFLKIRDPKVEQFVHQELERGQLWTDSLVQLNPSYKQGATVQELVQQGVLHPECERYFPDYRFRYHQEQAFLAAGRQEPYVLTTGTGSGKSMTYVVPLFDDLLRHPEIKGVRAILVYPMNALINSQKQEFDKFLARVPNSPIRVEQYTGQENLTRKSEIQNNPPHILLTNYVMLELMLTRTHEEKLVASPDLKFLILDELHTYRGRQGADVAMLIRKLRQRAGKDLLCIGTSATMSTKGDRQNRRQTVAGVASKLFGVPVQPQNVIDETLERSITRPQPVATELCQSITAGLSPESQQTLEAFKSHPIAAWIEMNFGLAEEEGHLVRRTPITLEAGAAKLAEQTQLPIETCLNTLKQMFLWGSKTGGLAFRLHQFISQGGSVYATIEPHTKRSLTLEGQYATTDDRLLYPLVFCRTCGQDYYVVRYDGEHQTVQPLLPTAIDLDPDNTDVREGYLTLNEPDLWREGDEERLPDSWFKETKREGRVPKKEYARFIPQRLQVLANGNVTNSLLDGTSCWFTAKPLMTCLNCGVVHDARRNEFVKLSRLSSEGRSTATTLLCLSTVSRLKSTLGEKSEAAKVLSFTDNRQDASLQAGHFNDFVQTSFLRSALHSALQANGTLTHAQLAAEVCKQMQLEQPDYARQVSEYGVGKRRNEEAFQNLIEYRLYEDLRRGGRIVQPNLEQCGLLAIEYIDLEEVCQAIEPWQKHPHPLLLRATPAERLVAAKTLLDLLRRELVIDARLLQPDRIEQLKKEVNQALKDPWTFDPYERLYEAKWASTSVGEQLGYQRRRSKLRLTARSKVGQFLRSPRAWNGLCESISDSEYALLINALIGVLCDSGYLIKDGTEVQLRIDSIQWRSQKTRTIAPDVLTARRIEGAEETPIPVNLFFQDFYERSAQQTHSMEGREHTGQVKTIKRQERETLFRKGELAALFCSPTMELGIDISDLNVVHLRNVPPSPANYAQRSGRAGRSGQGALVITYASAGSGHDQYFFRRQSQMVAGVVIPPKLELGNQDLIKSHLYSVWLAHTGLYLGDSMSQLLDLEQTDYPLKDSIQLQLNLSPDRLQHCLQAAQAILADTFCQADLNRMSWYSVDWLRQRIENAPQAFDRACQRWRELYSDAMTQLSVARQTIDRAMRGVATHEERKNAEDQEREARRQIDLLIGRVASGKSQSEFEFYPYRYFASEGFLPGYNFPRLPVRAYIPAGDEGEFISRPRIVALREFAPGNIVYYEGNKFQIAKTRVPAGGIEREYRRVSLCLQCGYFHEGDHAQRDTCENCNARITPDDRRNLPRLNRVLEMGTMITRRRERITCDEEERLKYGYNLTTHFRYESGRQETATVKAKDGKTLMKLSYGDTAKVWRINRGPRRNYNETGFKLDTKTGTWGESNDEPTIADTAQHSEVHLMVQDTCNVLVIEPTGIPIENAEAFLATLQYALERAIQAVYKLEDDELCSERLGQGRHLLFWEAAEGGAGVLSQIIENPNAFGAIAQAALDICHFIQEKESCIQACYECLLSYGNQFDHPLLNRHLIHAWLDNLMTSRIDRQVQGGSREAHYQWLRSQTDPNSQFERIVLDEIYKRGLKLPDTAQELIEEANCKPDFLYKAAKVAVFCDGSAHDHPDQQKRDRLERDNLKYNANYLVMVLRHNEDWQDKLGLLLGWLKG
ncbi:DEAD/DEAH box helicase [Leptolyngbya ohadii]|uniref:DEAD/DEAH box helicase n=1 Tax=Leptolyngbya ohadii TaxID=1962290 RepID=UPI000B598A64|nr:DEAD/DEAH box helicase [Leptolyngbya ohadii]